MQIRAGIVISQEYILIEKSVLFHQVPAPRDISDEEIQQLVQTGDATQFRVPLSLGEPHTEKDNG